MKSYQTKSSATRRNNYTSAQHAQWNRINRLGDSSGYRPASDDAYHQMMDEHENAQLRQEEKFKVGPGENVKDIYEEYYVKTGKMEVLGTKMREYAPHNPELVIEMLDYMPYKLQDNLTANIVNHATEEELKQYDNRLLFKLKAELSEGIRSDIEDELIQKVDKALGVENKVASSDRGRHSVAKGGSVDITVAAGPIGFSIESGSFTHNGKDYNFFSIGHAMGLEASVGFNLIDIREKGNVFRPKNYSGWSVTDNGSALIYTYGRESAFVRDVEPYRTGYKANNHGILSIGILPAGYSHVTGYTWIWEAPVKQPIDWTEYRVP